MKKLMTVLSFVLIFNNVFGEEEEYKSDFIPYSHSIYKVIVNPHAYNGKKISVFGFFCYKFEDTGLYATENDYKYANNSNAIWLELDAKKIVKGPDYPKTFETAEEYFKFLHKKWIYVTGKVKARKGVEEYGHMGLYSAEMEVEEIIQGSIWFDR